MALVRIEILRGRTAAEKRDLLEAVGEALVAVLRVPRGDPALRIIEHDPECFLRPSVPAATTDRYTLLEVVLFSGRSAEAKRALYREIVHRLGRIGTPEHDITIVLLESPRGNWGVQGGRPADEVELGFEVEI